MKTRRKSRDTMLALIIVAILVGFGFWERIETDKLANEGKMMSFNPDYDVPRTDKEVEICLGVYEDKLLSVSLRDLYQIERVRGKSVLDSWKKALEDHLRINLEIKAKE